MVLIIFFCYLLLSLWFGALILVKCSLVRGYFKARDKDISMGYFRLG